MFGKDKEIERARYDAIALRIGRVWPSKVVSGAESVVVYLREPYTVFESILGQLCGRGVSALELGSGTGEFTGAALRGGAIVTATDISANSLGLVRRRHAGFLDQIKTVEADMESLPFSSESFDVVFSAGSLSYGDNSQVLKEILRVLRPSGVFVCVDSLNHNPIYRLNRLWHVINGRRSRSTVLRMPTLKLIDEYASSFSSCDLRFFGAISWACPLLSVLIGAARTAQLSSVVDHVVGVRQSAFKFVLVASKAEGITWPR